MTYPAAKKQGEPYEKIVGDLPEMRLDTVTLNRQAKAERRSVHVLVNNRAEGNVPLTLQSLVEQLCDQLSVSVTSSHLCRRRGHHRERRFETPGHPEPSPGLSAPVDRPPPRHI